MAMEARRELYAWGANSYGQLGLDVVSEQVESPAKVDLDEVGAGVRLLRGGGGHSMMIDERGRLWSCGWNSRGQLGLGHRLNQRRFQLVSLPFPPDLSIVDVTCGWDFTVLLVSDGSAWACGSNAFGQIGLGADCKGIDGFVPIPGLANIKSLACGLRHSIFVDADGKLIGCGSSKRGQLGSVLEKMVDPPRELASEGPASQVAAGQHYTLALSKDGRLWGWGDGNYGQLPSFERINEVAREAKQICCGWSHAMLLCHDGQVYNWGRNDYNQLGRAPVTHFLAPDKLALQADSVAAGSEHCLAVTEESKLVSWGWNEHGNCGNKDTKNVSSPTSVLFPEMPRKILSLCAASGHNFAFVEI